jgi:hypothetical protein
LLQSNDRASEARSILGPALRDFSPTQELPAIAEARALLTTLAAEVDSIEI